MRALEHLEPACFAHPVASIRPLAAPRVGPLRPQIIIEVEESLAPAAAAALRATMQAACNLRVPLVVNLKWGSTWGSFRPMDI